jgi:hypothetical protein
VRILFDIFRGRSFEWLVLSQALSLIISSEMYDVGGEFQRQGAIRIATSWLTLKDLTLMIQMFAHAAQIHK